MPPTVIKPPAPSVHSAAMPVPNLKLRQPVSIYPTAETIEVAPGERYADIPPAKVPKAGIVRWVPAGDGTYRPRLQVMETWVRVGQCEQFGIHIKRDTLIRLGVGGFIDICQPSPMTRSISIETLLAHLKASHDPEFWNEERLGRYRRTMNAFRITQDAQKSSLNNAMPANATKARFNPRRGAAARHPEASPTTNKPEKPTKSYEQP